jgi:predicted transglutaminase-like cysteine proteinase
MKQYCQSVIVALLLGCSGAGTGLADSEGTSYSPGPATEIADGRNTAPPPGFVSFCMHNRSMCADSHGPVTKVALDEENFALLMEVNDRVNAAIAYQSDFKTFGVANNWNLHAIGSVGDCKDYALAKQQALIAAGLPREALRIAIVKTRDDQLHAVLTVDTDRGDYVLDNVNPAILAWSATPYDWLSRQSARNPLLWVTVAGNF